MVFVKIEEPAREGIYESDNRNYSEGHYEQDPGSPFQSVIRIAQDHKVDHIERRGHIMRNKIDSMNDIADCGRNCRISVKAH